jgi:RNA polymerase sigma-70 factor, ECF subfamily
MKQRIISYGSSTLNIQPDRELVESVIAGETESFSILVSRYMRSAIGIATGIVHDKHSAEDIAQDAFVLAYEKLNSLKNGNAFAPWLFQITRHRAIQSVRNKLPVKSLAEETYSSIPDDNYLIDDTQELLELIERLPEHERIVIRFKYFDGHSVRDIASMTGQTVGTVTKKLTRARNRLQTFLKKE